ncbi:MAG: SMP-30/gluconolactonase/LRE family protein [Novosphingobium sp.]|nr:SMP-30/gluconolactonase/LRE family protein [Novosphingobium sp.]MCP5404380.1 SMP-30/gluconolactonase/LRE family protein [Novosphingobium sp.]
MDVEIVAEDLQFPEGPVVCEDGSVIVVELRRQQVTRIRKDGTKQVVARVEGAPNGLAVGPDGALYCCNNGGSVWVQRPGRPGFVPAGAPEDYRYGWIDRIDISTGKVERLYTDCDGIPLAGPNDIVFDASGGFWFTDNGKDLATHERHGGLFHASADGSSIKRVVHGLALNGVGLSPDGETVYAAETPRRLLMAFPASSKDIAADSDAAIPATIGHGIFCGRIVASFPNREMLDSLAIEADGIVAQGKVAEGSGIARIDPETGQSELVEFPDRLPTNIAFGGSDMRDAYVTLSATGRLAKVRWPAPGMRLPFGC